jgi:hypothetical protein
MRPHETSLSGLVLVAASLLSSSLTLLSAQGHLFGDYPETATSRHSIIRVSVASDGAQADKDSSNPSILADGRYVAFKSSAGNLVSGDTNDVSDIFVHDLHTGESSRVSIPSDGAETDGRSRHPSISADARYVAFESVASNLMDGGEYAMEIARVDSAGQQQFVCADIVISEAETHHIDYGAWDGSGSMELQVDRKSDGVIDETIALENQVSAAAESRVDSAYPPAVIVLAGIAILTGIILTVGGATLVFTRSREGTEQESLPSWKRQLSWIAWPSLIGGSVLLVTGLSIAAVLLWQALGERWVRPGQGVVHTPAQASLLPVLPSVQPPAPGLTSTVELSPTPPTFVLSGCPDAPPQRVRVGDKALVCTKSASLALREQPKRDSSEIGRLDPGTPLEVVGGPSCSDGWSWWHVQTDSGAIGWVAEGGDDTDPYFICPLESTPTPPSQFVVTYYPVPLGTIANASSGFELPPTGSITLGGIPFYLTREIFTSQASSFPHSGYPTSAVLSVDVPRVVRVHLLLNTGNGFREFDGKVIGQVVARCSGVTIPVADLQLGQDVREWHSAHNVVSIAPRARQVWSGPLAGSPDLIGQIDMLSLDLPTTCQSGRLTALEIVDSSVSTVGSLDPALNLAGVTVEYISTEPQLTSTPICAAVTGPFAGVWSAVQDDIGCATTAPISGLVVEESFERGRMFWREPIDDAQALVLFDDGTWRIFQHEPFKEGDPEFACVDEDTPSQCPPTPRRGFGAMWCDIPQIRDGLGDAVDCERSYEEVMQEFVNGAMLQTDNGSVYVFYSSGRWERR